MQRIFSIWNQNCPKNEVSKISVNILENNLLKYELFLKMLWKTDIFVGKNLGFLR